MGVIAKVDFIKSTNGRKLCRNDAVTLTSS